MMPLSFQMNMPLNFMAYYGSFAILVTLLLRLILKRPLPKAVFPALWALVIVRLIVPFSISSPLSSGVPVFSTLKPPATLELSHGTSEYTMTMVPTQTTPQIDWSVVVSVLFCIGVVVTVVVLMLQKRYYDKQLSDCLPLTENRAVNDTLREMGMKCIPVFTCDSITTPLVHGLLHPHIYLPAKMNFTDSKLVRHILLHELVHIRQKHNWLKTAMLAALCINWYNPLVWVMAYCMGADIESACDAAVMKLTSGNERHDYAKSLLAMSMTEKRPVLLYNSFAKTEVEQRIKGVLRYRKTAIPVLVVSALLFATCTVAVATVGQAEFSIDVSSTHATDSGRWWLRVDQRWNLPLGENARERIDRILAQILTEGNTDDTALLERQLQTALEEEFDVSATAFFLSKQLIGTDEEFDAEYAASGMTTDKIGRYVFEGEPVRMMEDQVRSFGSTNPMGTVDVVIKRDSMGGIAAIIAYRKGDAVYDRHTSEFPG